MRDKRIDELYPPVREAAEKFLEEAATIGAMLYCGYRSLPDQKIIYTQGRTTPGNIVTDARPGWSYHNYALAIDVVFKDGAGDWSWAPSFDWPALGRIGKKHGFAWGGDWPEPCINDLPHFQMDFGISVQRLYIVYARTWLLQNVWAWLSNEGITA